MECIRKSINSCCHKCCLSKSKPNIQVKCLPIARTCSKIERNGREDAQPLRLCFYFLVIFYHQHQELWAARGKRKTLLLSRQSPMWQLAASLLSQWKMSSWSKHTHHLVLNEKKANALNNHRAEALTIPLAGLWSGYRQPYFLSGDILSFSLPLLS